MKSLLELIKALYGSKAISSTLGTRTNVVRLPTGKLQRYLSEDLNIEMASDNAAINAYREMEQLVLDIPKMNDAERLIFEGNLRRLKNKLEASNLIPKQKVTKEGEVIEMETKEQVTGKGLEELIEKQGTINPPTTVSGRLELSAKKLEDLKKKVEDEFAAGKKRKTAGELLDEYFSSFSSMKQVEDTALVRAVAREIMYQDLKAGRLKVPEDVSDVIRGIGPANRDVLDEFSQYYGVSAIEDLYDNADRFYRMVSPKEAVDFLKKNETSNWTQVFQPREKPIKDYMTLEEFREMMKDATINKYGVISPKASESLDKETAKEIYDSYLKLGDRDLIIKEINEISEGKKFDVYKVEDRNKIIDILTDVLKKLGPPVTTGAVGLDYLAEKSTPPKTEGGTQQSLGLDYLTGVEPSEGYADGGRIGFKAGSGKKVLDLILEANQKLKNKKSMETVNPKTGEVTTLKEPVKVTQKYEDDIIRAANNIFPNYDDPRIAADQIVDSYAQLKFGLEDQYGLSNKQRMDLYTQAYDYVMDYNRGIITKKAKQLNQLDEFEIEGREPNAVGGRVGYAGGSDGAPSITLDSHDKAPDNMDKYPVKVGNLELGIMGAMSSGKSTPDPYVKINTADRNFTVRGKYNVPDTGISLLGDIGDVRMRNTQNINVPQYNYKESIRDVMRFNPYSVGIEYAPDKNKNINLRYDDRGNVTLRGEAKFAKGGLGYLMGE